MLERLEELDELVILDDPAGHPAVVATTRDNRPLDPDRWAEATADIPGLGHPRILRWDQLPTTATWKVRRPALRDQLFPTPRTAPATPPAPLGDDRLTQPGPQPTRLPRRL